MLDQTVRARIDPSGHQVVDITVHRGYQPDSIRAQAGMPLRVVFRREDDDACSERVVFSNPRLDRRLAATGVTTIDLPAHPVGEIRFTCGMGRYRGRIQLVDDRRPAILARLRRRAIPARVTACDRAGALDLPPADRAGRDPRRRRADGARRRRHRSRRPGSRPRVGGPRLYAPDMVRPP